jgi:hypothetical protein
MDRINKIRKAVRQLITIKEQIQADVIQGHTLTPDEASMVRLCSMELYHVAKSRSDANGQLENSGRAEASLSRPS